MLHNKKVQYTFDEILDLSNKFESEKGVRATHCYVNPELVDVDFFLKEARSLMRYDAYPVDHILGKPDLTIAGIQFIDDISIKSQLKLIHVNIIE